MSPRIPRRILIVNPFGIGDVLFTTPVIRALRHAFPACHLAYLCNRRTERILRTNPHLDELFVYEKDELVHLWRTSWWQGVVFLWNFLRRIHRARFDLAVDLSLGERYAWILMVLGVRRRIGFNYRNRGRFLTDSLPIDGYQEAHVVDYYQWFLRCLGITLLDSSLELVVSEDDERWATEWLRVHQLEGTHPLVGLVPAGGVSWGIDAPFRRWNNEGFAAVADALVTQYGAQAVIFGESTDVTVCQTVARLMTHPAINVAGLTTLGQFVSLLGHLSLVICNDGGPLHLAVSRGVKTVSVFGPVDPKVYGPYPALPSCHRVVCHEGLPCRPCYHQFKLPPCPYERACLTMISPAEVLEACRHLLEPSPLSPAAPHEVMPRV